jgi:hypothetical protein
VASTNTATPSWLERRLGRGGRRQLTDGNSGRAIGWSWRRRGRGRNSWWRRRWSQCHRHLRDCGWAGSDRRSRARQALPRARPATRRPATLCSRPGARRRNVPQRGVLQTPGSLGQRRSHLLIGGPQAVPMVGPARQQHHHRGGRRRQGRHGGGAACPPRCWGEILLPFASCRFGGLVKARVGLRLLALPAQRFRRARLWLVEYLELASAEHGSLQELRERPVLDPNPRSRQRAPDSLSARCGRCRSGAGPVERLAVTNSPICFRNVSRVPGRAAGPGAAALGTARSSVLDFHRSSSAGAGSRTYQTPAVRPERRREATPRDASIYPGAGAISAVVAIQSFTVAAVSPP